VNAGANGLEAISQKAPGGEPTHCSWALGGDALYLAYHDGEWGVPSHDDRHLFEMLILEGFQAGLSWRTILQKRGAFRQAFGGFDPAAVARFGEEKISELMGNPGIVRNRLKIAAAIGNAKAFLQIREEFGSFSNYLWGWVGNTPIRYFGGPIPARTPLSDALSLELKRRGMKFVGSVIIYSFLQAVGVVDDHEPGCFKHKP
jgi:DNA-3-methyladenine glycosylase I